MSSYAPCRCFCTLQTPPLTNLHKNKKSLNHLIPSDDTLVGFLVVGFLVAGFLVVGFLVVGFLVVGFLVFGFLVVGFLVVGFLVDGFRLVVDVVVVVGFVVVVDVLTERKSYKIWNFHP